MTDLHVEVGGAGPPLVLLHGFTGSARTWDGVRPALAACATLVAVDLVGHGQSPAPEDTTSYTLDRAVIDLEWVLDRLGLPSVDLLGYSLGGRLALYLAVHRPMRVRRLILESASPGIEDAAERRERAEADCALAERIGREGLDAFVRHWEAQPLLRLGRHLPPRALARQHALRLRNNPMGLANSLRGMGVGQQEPVWSSLRELAVPVGMIVGERDVRYRAIAERMQRLLPDASTSVIPESGHSVHIDQPEAFVRVVKGQLAPN